MKKNLLFLIKIFAIFILYMALQKVAFMAVNAGYGSGLHLTDWLSVVWHGLRLDCVMACYLMVVPILVCLVASFVPRINLRKSLLWWYVAAALLCTVAFLADAVLYNFWGAKLDVADFIYAKNPKDMFASLSIWLILLAFIAIGALTWGVSWLLYKATPEHFESLRHRWMSPLVLILLLAVDFVGIRGGLDESTANPSYAYFSDNAYLDHAALNPMFNVLHSMEKNEDLSQEFPFYDEADLRRITDPIYAYHPDIADTLLSTRRPNIILIVWEGGGSLMVDNDTIAPHYARLKSEGVYFSNLYANNFRTDRGLVSLLNGWLGLPTTSVMKMSGRCGRLPALAKSLKANGYHTGFYYGGDIDFTNMRGYLYETGYDQVLGGENYSWAPNQSKWGADDQYLFQTSHSPLPASPFFATYLTLSSHEPWTVPYHRLTNLKDNAFAYTDSCVFAFVAALKASSQWNNTLLIIVPDHGVARGSLSLSDARVSKIPMLWLGGAVKSPKVVDRLMNQSDIAATLLCQMGIDCRDFLLSRNVLSRQYQPTVAVHAYKNGFNVVTPDSSCRFECVEGNIVPAKSVTNQQLALAKALLQLAYQRTAEL